MSAFDLTAADAALKEYYDGGAVINMGYQDNAFHSMVPKFTKSQGKREPIPIIYGSPQGRSSSFTRAKANKTPSKIEDFLITRAKDYGLADMDIETIMAGTGGEGSWFPLLTFEIDQTIYSLSRSLAVKEYRNGSGEIGQIGSISTTTITLADPEAATNFEVGMVLNASTAAGGGTVKQNSGADGRATVTKVNRIDGTVELATDPTAYTTAWAANDYLFVDGDYDSAIKGLEAWMPASAPSSGESFFGVDRSVDSRLAGLRHNGVGQPIEEALIDAVKIGLREGGNIDMGFMPYDKYGDLEKELGSKVQYIQNQVTAEISWQGIIMKHSKGKFQVIADQNCIADTAFLLTTKYRGQDIWQLRSIGDAVHIQKPDGLRILRVSDADSVEVRTAYYAQLSCRAPGFSVRVAL